MMSSECWVCAHERSLNPAVNAIMTVTPVRWRITSPDDPNFAAHACDRHVLTTAHTSAEAGQRVTLQRVLRETDTDDTWARVESVLGVAAREWSRRRPP